MKLLLDTHLLLWASAWPERLTAEASALIASPDNQPMFSAASIWEVAIKSTLGRADFRVDPGRLRRGLLDNGYLELAIEGTHAVAVHRLAQIHKDPFDRILVAQALVEGIVLLTADPRVAGYDGLIRRV